MTAGRRLWRVRGEGGRGSARQPWPHPRLREQLPVCHVRQPSPTLPFAPTDCWCVSLWILRRCVPAQYCAVWRDPVVCS